MEFIHANRHNSVKNKYLTPCICTYNKHVLRVGWAMLGKMFRLCQPFDGTRKENIATLVETLLGNFETIVQYNKAQLRFERQSSVHK